jgi:hypothetical protein
MKERTGRSCCRWWEASSQGRDLDRDHPQHEACLFEKQLTCFTSESDPKGRKVRDRQRRAMSSVLRPTSAPYFLTWVYFDEVPPELLHGEVEKWGGDAWKNYP